MKIESPPAASPDSKSPATPATGDRPGSATACYALALLSVLGAFVVGGLAIGGTLPEAGQLAVFCGAGAVLWWALGDIVSYLARLARR